MKVVRKLLAPLLVVGILLTSLISLHQLKADKKKDVFRIGISQFITHQSLDATREGFVDELAKQGYVEGKNIEIDLQNAQGEQRNLKTISQQLAESSDVVLAIATPSAQSLANTTQTTPVIFSAVTDPVSAKLVESREHPGGNVTGTSDQSSDAISTQINLIKKVLPKAKTIGILYTQSEPNSVVQKDEAKRILEEKGFTVVEKTILDSNNAKAAAESLMAEVDMVFDGEEAMDIISTDSYDLIILDLNLPGMDGLDILKNMRASDNETNVLILSARGGLNDKIEGLDSGANDYLCKPFHFEELEARVRSLTRRRTVQNNIVLECGEISLNTKTRTAFAKGEEIALTRKELAILEYLILHQGRPVSQEELIEHVWDSSVDSFSNSIRVHISALRKKIRTALGKDPITNRVGQGYVIGGDGE